MLNVHSLSANGASDLSQFRVQRHFADHRAISPGTAIEYAPSSPAERQAFDRLRDMGVIREAHPAHYWFDLDRIGQDRSRERNPKLRVAIVLGAVLAFAAWYLSRY
ncbi:MULTISPECIES: hypothetical protein [unclassified Sphingomonas]|uniref:hypothetical protein n=1 Tax=unclassified Sphingomonas TaxID=196159 RepID=UPI0021511AE7|nr:MULTISPECIES: hypothetical protein [unclassified Sphingomonas]MCR5871598.1 hypothetical protein [Sphingomonas sp. J344]UUY00109.1 hypothetical protein LRS08_02955 [Sphingomonas sp. J315]